MSPAGVTLVGYMAALKTKSNPKGAGRNPRAGVATTARAAIRLTQDELALWHAAASDEGLSLADWIRAACEARLKKGRTKR